MVSTKELCRSSLVLALMMVLYVGDGNSVDITIVDGGYRDVIVAIGDDLSESKCNIYVAEIKEMIDSASSLLYSATGSKVFFSEVTILIPSNWTTCGGEVISDNISYSFDDAHIRVKSPHPYFANNPWTQQPRGCGKHGDFMYFSDQFLEQEPANFGAKGTVFVHEWSKFRWGVFEEYGHLGDSVFPSAYRNTNTDFVPNYCANGDIKGQMHNCGTGNLEEECAFTPDVEQSSNITSSLLGVPFVNSVKTFCDDNTHDATVPTKQNLLCNKQSTWSVISKHPDLSQTTPATTIKDNTTYFIQHATSRSSTHRMVFVLDTTKLMKDVSSRWEYLRESVRQFILNKAPDGSKIGLVSLKNTPEKLTPTLVTLNNSTTRVALANLVPDDAGKDTEKRVSLGLTAAAELLGDVGKIILVTENLEEHTGETAEQIRDSSNGLAVQPILYPAFANVSFDLYIPVAQFSNLSPVIVYDLRDDDHATIQGVQCFGNLTNIILDSSQITLTTVAGQSGPLELGIQIDVQVGAASGYEAEFFVEVMLQAAIAESTNITVIDNSGTYLRLIENGGFNRLFYGTNFHDGPYSISPSTPYVPPAYVNVYATPKNISQPYSISVSASEPLDTLQYSEVSAPVIYAMLSEGIHPVVFADVTASIRSMSTSGEIKITNLTLQDNGVGGDVTGNDGIYSSYLIGIEQKGSLSISVEASDNEGTAKIVIPPTSMNSAPISGDGLDKACCGSSLVLPDTILQDAGVFSTGSEPGISGQADGTFVAEFMYPPGRVTDLKGERIQNTFHFSFTATGEDFDVGEAKSYYLKNSMEPSYVKNLNVSAMAGAPLSALVDVTCNTQYVFTVEAVDTVNKTGAPSNEVRLIYSCVIDSGGLTAGAIAGIVIGCLVFLIILIVIVLYCCKNGGNVKETAIGKFLCCQCLKKKKTKDRNSHLAPSRTGKDNDVIRRNPAPQGVSNTGHIRASNPPTAAFNVEDLYTKPIKKKADSGSEGGFSQNRMQRGVVQSNIRDDSSDAASSYGTNPTNLPRNQVGIPPAKYPVQFNTRYNEHDNAAYASNSDEDGYSMAPYPKRPILPPISKPRLEAQV